MDTYSLEWWASGWRGWFDQTIIINWSRERNGVGYQNDVDKWSRVHRVTSMVYVFHWSVREDWIRVIWFGQFCSFVECTVIWNQFSIVCVEWFSITILLYRPIENVESVSIDIDGLERTASIFEFPGDVRCCVTMAIEFMWCCIIWNDVL